MTAIVISKLSKNKCIVASDRRLTDELGTVSVDAHAKVKKLYGCLVGSAGDVAPFEVFLTLNSLEGFAEAKDKMQYILFRIMPQFKKALKTLSLVEDNTPLGLFDTDIILCNKGECFNIALNGQHGVEVLPISLPAGFGCGGKVALGAFKAIQAIGAISLYEDKKSIRQQKIVLGMQLTKALEITAELDNACDDNIDIIYE